MRTASVLEEILFNGALMFAVYRDNSVVSAFSRALIIGSITTSSQKINYCFEKKSGKSLDFYGHSKICTNPVITIKITVSYTCCTISCSCCNCAGSH